jgi:hypothetical protein
VTLNQPRYIRASLWSLPIEFIAIDLLFGAAQKVSVDNVKFPEETHFLIMISLGLYIAAITVGHLGVSAWLAKRNIYSVIRCTLLNSAIILVLAASFSSVYVIVVNPSPGDYPPCETVRCYTYNFLGMAGIGAGFAEAFALPTCVLWFWLAKPRTPNPAPNRPRKIRGAG